MSVVLRAHVHKECEVKSSFFVHDWSQGGWCWRRGGTTASEGKMAWGEEGREGVLQGMWQRGELKDLCISLLQCSALDHHRQSLLEAREDNSRKSNGERAVLVLAWRNYYICLYINSMWSARFYTSTCIVLYSMIIKVTAAFEIRGCSARVSVLVTDNLQNLGDWGWWQWYLSIYKSNVIDDCTNSCTKVIVLIKRYIWRI